MGTIQSINQILAQPFEHVHTRQLAVDAGLTHIPIVSLWGGTSVHMIKNTWGKLTWCYMTDGGYDDFDIMMYVRMGDSGVSKWGTNHYAVTAETISPSSANTLQFHTFNIGTSILYQGRRMQIYLWAPEDEAKAYDIINRGIYLHD